MLFGIFICWTTIQSLKIIIERPYVRYGKRIILTMVILLVQLSEMPVTQASPGVETKSCGGGGIMDRFPLSILS